MEDPQLEQFLAYLSSSVPDARVRHWGALDNERLLLVRFDIPGTGPRYLRISPELWTSIRDLGQLREHLERHQWREHVLSPESESYVTLGEAGWCPPDGDL